MLLRTYIEETNTSNTRSDKRMEDHAKFILFSTGVGVAAASSITSLYFLYQSLLGTQSTVYEPNPILAIIEIALLILAAATCLVASEIYYKYLQMKKSMNAEK